MNEQRAGISLTTVILAVFVILKLCNLIDWSWGWVLSPLWFSIGLIWFFHFKDSV